MDLKDLLIFFVSCYFLVFLGLLVVYLCAIAARIEPIGFKLGVGPVLLNKYYRSTNFLFKLIPLGGYVNFVHSKDLDDTGKATQGCFDYAHPLLRTFIILSGYLVLASPIVFYSELPVMEHVAMIYKAIVGGAFHPMTSGVSIIENAVDQYGNSTLWGKVFALSIFLGVLNLTPIPPLAGGHAILGLIEWKRTATPQWTLAAFKAGITIILLLLCAWVFALGCYFLQ